MRSVIATIAVCAALPAYAQDIPRTPQGKPDFQGVWSAEFLTPMERPDDFTDLIIPPDKAEDARKKMLPDFGEVYDPELDYSFPTTLLEMNGELRSSIIVTPADGKLPLTALARATLKSGKPNFDDPEMRPGSERCVDSLIHPPLRAISHVIPFQVVQTPDAIVFSIEDIDPVRIIGFNAPALPDAVRTRAGQSRARWEEDTLIVETDHFAVSDPAGILGRDAALVTEDSRVTERFRLVSPDAILYQFTIDDPSLYRTPWLGEYILTRNADPSYEYACHEGNHALANILTAARMGKQEEKKKPD
jgi:hypothetical protein